MHRRIEQPLNVREPARYSVFLGVFQQPQHLLYVCHASSPVLRLGTRHDARFHCITVSDRRWAREAGYLQWPLTS